jgi:hypothetical protein
MGVSSGSEIAGMEEWNPIGFVNGFRRKRCKSDRVLGNLAGTERCGGETGEIIGNEVIRGIHRNVIGSYLVVEVRGFGDV